MMSDLKLDYYRKKSGMVFKRLDPHTLPLDQEYASSNTERLVVDN